MLNGQTALVTGGSRGIGFAVAQELLAAGANVMITARTGVEEAVAALGGNSAGIVCDVADYAQAEKAVAATVKRFGGLSLLINNAGVIDPIGSLAESDPAQWAQNIQINQKYLVLIGSWAEQPSATHIVLLAGTLDIMQQRVTLTAGLRLTNSTNILIHLFK